MWREWYLGKRCFVGNLFPLWREWDRPSSIEEGRREVKARTEKDFGSTRYGFGGVRTYLTKRTRVRADRAILRAANELGWTASEFRLWSESKLGRWYGDLFLFNAKALNGRRAVVVAREFLDEVAWSEYRKAIVG
jgi:hypothetical protein